MVFLFELLPCLSLCIIYVILIAEGRLRDPPIVRGFNFFLIKYETSEDVRKPSQELLYMFSKIQFDFILSARSCL